MIAQYRFQSDKGETLVQYICWLVTSNTIILWHILDVYHFKAELKFRSLSHTGKEQLSTVVQHFALLVLRSCSSLIVEFCEFAPSLTVIVVHRYRCYRCLGNSCFILVGFGLTAKHQFHIYTTKL